MTQTELALVGGVNPPPPKPSIAETFPTDISLEQHVKNMAELTQKAQQTQRLETLINLGMLVAEFPLAPGQFSPHVTTLCQGVLRDNGIHTWSQLLNRTEEQLLNLDGFGEKSAAVVRVYVAYQLAFLRGEIKS